MGAKCQYIYPCTEGPQFHWFYFVSHEVYAPEVGQCDGDKTCVLLSLSGDEIFAVNGESVAGLSHAEVIGMFKSVRAGKIILHVGRRAHHKSR